MKSVDFHRLTDSDLISLMLDRCGMKEATSLVEIWLNLLTRLPKWNVDKSILYLLNVVARIGWIQYNDVIKSTISTMLNEANVYRPSKGLASRVGVFSHFLFLI